MQDVKSLMSLLDVGYKCSFREVSAAHPTSIAAFSLIFKDMRILYHALNKGVLRLLENYFEMPKMVPRPTHTAPHTQRPPLQPQPTPPRARALRSRDARARAGGVQDPRPVQVLPRTRQKGAPLLRRAPAHPCPSSASSKEIRRSVSVGGQGSPRAPAGRHAASLPGQVSKMFDDAHELLGQVACPAPLEPFRATTRAGPRPRRSAMPARRPPPPLERHASAPVAHPRSNVLTSVLTAVQDRIDLNPPPESFLEALEAYLDQDDYTPSAQVQPRGGPASYPPPREAGLEAY